MLLPLLAEGRVALFVMILVAIILSLSFHEFGHAWSAKMYGDDTAQRLGRLTINPISHIDPVGLLMVVLVGIGYAKPVPFNPNNFKSMWAVAGVALAGPAANLIIAFITINVQAYLYVSGSGLGASQGVLMFLEVLIIINLLLMLFNLIPLGVLDGHHILPYFLPRKVAALYRQYNAQYGMFALLGLLLLSYIGVPVLGFLHAASASIRSFLLVVA